MNKIVPVSLNPSVWFAMYNYIHTYEIPLKSVIVTLTV